VPFAAAGAGAAAAGLVAPVEVFGLKKSAKELLAGDAAAAGLAAAAAAFARARLPVGEAAGDAAGLAAVAAVACLRARLVLGEAAGEAAAAGDAPVSVVSAVVAAFLRVRCFAGDSPGLGD